MEVPTEFLLPPHIQDIRVFDCVTMTLVALLPCYTTDAISMILNVSVQDDNLQVGSLLRNSKAF